MVTKNRVHWVFILRAKIDLTDIDGQFFPAGSTLGMWQAPDHPCFGNNDPELVPHPFMDFDENIHEIICITPTDEEVQQILAKATQGEGVQSKDFLEVVVDDYDIDDTVQPSYPDIKIAIGLPDDWQELPAGSKVKTVKKRIFQPPMVRTAKLKKKVKQIGPGQ